MNAHPIAGQGSIVQRLKALLGPCVLIAFNSKRPTRKEWQKFPIADMSIPQPQLPIQFDAGSRLKHSLGKRRRRSQTPAEHFRTSPKEEAQ